MKSEAFGESGRTVAWQPDGSPFSPRFGDVYRSQGAGGDAGLAQARHVFLRGCGLLPERDAPAAWAGQPSWQVLETGFGLGLNFLATWQTWRDDPARPARLFYSAVEAYVPEADDLIRSAAPWPALAPLAAELASLWRGLLPGVHRLRLDGGRVQLTLAVGDVQPMLAELSGQADSLFLDGFSPERNPDMWSLHTLKAVARLTRRGARAASWCVAREVREHLVTCGFEVERVPGLPPKRNALRARHAPRWQPRTRADAQPSIEQPGRCLVIGGGLAGASVAYSLAERGWRVAVLDAAPQPAAGASGLPAGVVAPHVSPDDRPLSRLTRAGTAATLARARALLAEGIDFGATGVLERHAPGERRLPTHWPEADHARAAAALSMHATAPITQKQAAAAGAPLDADHPALWHAGAGWIRPAALVRAMLAHPGIDWRGGCAVAALRPHGAQWHALDAHGNPLAEADLAVVAAGYASLRLLDAAAPDHALPLHALRGQVAHGPMPGGAADAALPPFPVNGHGSLIAHLPGPGGARWVAGSTFERGNEQAETRADDHAHNRQRLAELLPAAGAALTSQFDDGRATAWAGVRCTVPDRLPALGPLLPNAFKQNVAETKHTPAQDAYESIANSGFPPLWGFTGLGARGLTLSVLGGEIAAAWLHGEPLPVARSLAERLRAQRWAALKPRNGG